MTVKQIAELAGVSRGTVDRALNNRGNIKAEVEHRIREIALELGYIPNRAGKALASRKNPMTFGMVVNAVKNPFFEELLRGAEETTAEYADFGLKLKIMSARGYETETQLAHLTELQESGVSGIALAPINDPAVAAKINSLMDAGIPVITVNNDIEQANRLCYVGCNYLKSGITAGGLLRLLKPEGGRGCIVTGSVRMLGHNQRVSGFVGVCKEAGIEITDIGENLDDDELSYQVTQRLLRKFSPDALYFTAGGIAGGMQALAGHIGKRPLVITCDDTKEVQAGIADGLIQATVCQQPYEQGRQAIRILFDRLVNGNLPCADCYMDNIIKIRENLKYRNFY